MPFHDCRNFVAECGCGASHVADPACFHPIQDEYDNSVWTVSQIVHEKDAGQNGKQKLSLLITDSKNHKYTFVFNDYNGCICELLLFAIVNFEIAETSSEPLLSAIKKHENCWVTYRYESEMGALIQYLEKKKNTKEMISFFQEAWFRAYKKYPDKEEANPLSNKNFGFKNRLGKFMRTIGKNTGNFFRQIYKRVR